MDNILLSYTLVFLILSSIIIYIWKNKFGYISYSVVFILSFLFIAGILASNWRSILVDDDLRSSLKRQAEAIARTINPERIKALNFNQDDKNIPEFQRLKEQLTSYSKTLNIQGIYSLAQIGDSLVFGPESYPEEHPSASEPGTIYEKPSDDVINIFKNGKAFTEGPLEDEYGIFVSALAPVFDPSSGKVILVIGIDIDINQWTSILNKHRIIAYISTLLFVLVLLGGSILLSAKRKITSKSGILIKYSEAFIVAAFGLNLTIVAILVSYDYESRNREQMLTQIAEPQARSIIKAFKNMHDFHLGGTARYLQKESNINRNDFHSVMAPSLRLNGFETSIGWVIPVNANNKITFENNIIKSELKNFYIWEKNSLGEKTKVQNRDVFYPILFLEPVKENEEFLGYDLGSDSAIKREIDLAVSTKLPVASNPLVLLPNINKNNVIIYLQPVFSSDSSKNQLLGFTIAIVKVESFLLKALYSEHSKETSSTLDLYQISKEGSDIFIASTSDEINKKNISLVEKIESEHTVQYPVLIFDKAYSLIIYPDKKSFSANLVFTGLVTGIIGSLVTFLFTAFTVFLSRRKTDLEIQVNAKTYELRKSESDLRKLNSEKDKFFSIIAHDLRSPFVSFLGLTEVMTQDISDMSMEEINKLAKNLNQNANNLYRLLTNLLEWSTMKRGITKFNPEQLSVSELIGNNINLFKEQAKAKNITLTMRMTENISILADKQMIDTVIRNLISNALKFTTDGGKVIVSAFLNNNNVEISVQDNGLGMNKNILDNLFKLDEKTNRKGTNDEPSTGLGLLLCKEFIEKHNGTLSVQSEEGKGSKFTFTLGKQ